MKTKNTERHQVDLTTEVVASFPNGGRVEVYNAIDRDTADFHRILSCAKYFAQQGKQVVMPTKKDVPYKNPAYDQIYASLRGTPYYGKCPDMLIDEYGYEHEGYITDSHKHALKNMLKHGLTQSDRIIIEKTNLTDNYIKARIKGKIDEGKRVEEVWIRDGDKLSLIFKNTNDQPNRMN